MFKLISKITQKEGKVTLRFYDNERNVIFEKEYKTFKSAQAAQTRLFNKYVGR